MDELDGLPLDAQALTRWYPSTILDLPPLEPVFATRTPHRISYQAMPSSRHVLRTLLSGPSFELTVELDRDDAQLLHVPMHEVHEARLTPLQPLDWLQYYWLIDGLQDDLAAAEASSGLARGRRRLAVVEQCFRELPRGATCELARIVAAWADKGDSEAVQPPRLRHADPIQTFQQYVHGLTGHLVAHATSRAFSDWAADLLREAEKTPLHLALPQLGEAEGRLVRLYLQHRLNGSSWLVTPAGMIAGWHLMLSVYVLAVWFAGLLLRSGYEKKLEEALFGSLWMLDQGFWRDEPLVHDVLRNLNASEYTTPELAVALTTAMRRIASPA